MEEQPKKKGRKPKAEGEKFVQFHMKMHPVLNARLLKLIPDKKRAAFVSFSLEFMLDVVEGKRTLPEMLNELEEREIPHS